MPSKSPAQARLMAATAHGWRKPGGGGPTREVAEEFNEADRGGETLSQGMAMASAMRERKGRG